MNNSLKMIVVLAAVSLLSAASLVFVYNYAQPQIAENQRAELEEAIFKVLPDARAYETIGRDGEEIYVGKDAAGRVIGYAVLAKGAGYQGEIRLIAGLDPGMGRIFGIEVLESVETPGLGGLINEEGFKAKFKNLLATPQINLVKETPTRPNEVQAITGATVSSNAVVNVLNDKIEKARELIRR